MIPVDPPVVWGTTAQLDMTHQPTEREIATFWE
jgi:hypothetical protein